jgi:MFS family permease
MAREIYYGWWVVAACFLIAFYVGGTVFFGFTAFLQPLKDEFGWSYTQISFAASLRGLEMGLLAPVVGLMVDRLGSRKLMFAGAIILGSGLILLSLTQSLVMFYGSFLLIAFGAGGCMSVVTMTLVANWFYKRIGLAMGIMASGFGASGLIVPLIVRLIDMYNWRITLILLGFGMWFLGIPLCSIIRNSPENLGLLPDGAPSDGPDSNTLLQDHRTEIPLREAMKDKAFLYLNLAEAIRLMILGAVVTHVIPYLTAIGMERAPAGYVAATIPLFSIVGRFSSGWLSDIFQKRYVLALCFLSMGAGVLFFSYVHLAWAIPVFILFFSPGFGGGIVLRGAILREYFGRKSFGSMVGIIMGAASFGGIIGPILAGWVYDTFGTYRPVWLSFLALLSLAAFLVMRMGPSRRIRAT